jgi:hypothetical protein
LNSLFNLCPRQDVAAVLALKKPIPKRGKMPDANRAIWNIATSARRADFESIALMLCRLLPRSMLGAVPLPVPARDLCCRRLDWHEQAVDVVPHALALGLGIEPSMPSVAEAAVNELVGPTGGFDEMA